MQKSILIIISLTCSSLLFSQVKTDSFKLCDKVGVWPYYNPDLTYKGGFWEVKQVYQAEYPLATFQKLRNNSGIITIQFLVNCKGETGYFKIQQCDLNYQPTTLNQSIVDYFLSKTKTLKNWEPAKGEKGNVVNSHKFFSFRLKNGQLLEILPK